MTELFLCRHAETVANVEGWVSGWRDVPLTERGVLQARELARALKHAGAFGGILSSDLTRARRTAEAIRDHLGLDLVLDSGLRERDYGEWTGTPYRVAFSERLDLWEPLRNEDNAAPPGGETLAGHRRRVFEALERGRERWPRGFIAVTHRGVIRLLLQTLGIRENGRIPDLPDPPDFIRIRWDGGVSGKMENTSHHKSDGGSNGF